MSDTPRTAWAGSTRRARLPRNWTRLRRRVVRRARRQCEAVVHGRRCPAVGTDVDHVVRGDDHSLANLQLLCLEHHAAKTQAEAQQARAEQGRTARRPDEPHPASRR